VPACIACTSASLIRWMLVALTYPRRSAMSVVLGSVCRKDSLCPTRPLRLGHAGRPVGYPKNTKLRRRLFHRREIVSRGSRCIPYYASACATFRAHDPESFRLSCQGCRAPKVHLKIHRTALAPPRAQLEGMDGSIPPLESKR
jgi:hypothetical protein